MAEKTDIVDAVHQHDEGEKVRFLVMNDTEAVVNRNGAAERG
jgi:hypothetical protein